MAQNIMTDPIREAQKGANGNDDNAFDKFWLIFIKDIIMPVPQISTNTLQVTNKYLQNREQF